MLLPTLMHITILIPDPIRVLCTLAQMSFLIWESTLSHIEMVMESCLLLCCLIMLLVNILQSSDPGDGRAASREMKK